MNKTSKSNTSLGTSLIILSSLFYASYGIWTTLMGDFFSGYTASAIRSILVLIILIPIGLFRKQFGSLDFANNWKKLLSMVFISTLVWGLLYYSVLNAGIGVSSTVNYAAIVIGMVFFGWLLAKEKFTSDKKWSLAIGMFGLLLIFIQTSSGSIGFMPLIAAVISGLAIAANTVIAKQLPYNTIQTTCVFWATSVIANIPMIFILNEQLPQVGLYVEWFYLLMFAICSLLASWTLMRGLKYIDAGLAGILGLLEIVFGVMFGIILFNERIELLTILGVIIILLSSVFPYLLSLIKRKIKSNE